VGFDPSPRIYVALATANLKLLFRWVEHMAELELEIGAPSEEGVFAEALAAFAELAGEGSGPSVSRAVEVEADDGAMLLVEWLSELVYLCEVEQFVPRRISLLELGDGKLRATVEGHRGRPRHFVKAVTLHRLELRPDDKVGWRARVVLDV
jgi:SHS2 domain-containing protein